MGKRDRRIWKIGWLAAAVAIWVVMVSLVVCAETTGSVTLQLPKGSDGVEMTLYAVASFDQGNYTYRGEFASANLVIDDLNDDAQAQAAAERLAVYADLQEIQGISAASDADGQIRFDDLEPALYLIAQTGGMNQLEVQPALVPVPYAASDGQEWIYDAVISPKYSIPGGAVIVSKVDEEGNAVGQARFVLQKKIYFDEIGDLPEETVTYSDEDGTYYWKEFQANLISSENGQVVIRDMPFGTYRFVETQSPDGYILTGVPEEFTIDSAGTVEETGGVYEEASGEVAALTVVNPRTTVLVSKVDESGSSVPGAKLVVKDSEGNVLLDADGNASYCFTTTEQPCELKALPAGNYYLCELESPDGYQVAQDVLFSVSDEADAVNTVTMVDEQEEDTTVSFRVAKSLTDLTGRSIMAEDSVFYVALFADEACTSRVSDVQPLSYLASSDAETTFANLQPDTDYYVAETTEYGEVIQSSGAYIPYYENGQQACMTLESPEGELSFRNIITDLTSPELPGYQYYYSGKLTITKQVLLGTDAYDTDDVFYAALFTDAAHTERYGNVIALEMDGCSTLSVTLDVAIGTNAGASMTYYVTETDESGIPLENGTDLEYTVGIDKTSVTFGPDHLEDEVTITNTFEEEEKQTEQQTEPDTAVPATEEPKSGKTSETPSTEEPESGETSETPSTEELESGETSETLSTEEPESGETSETLSTEEPESGETSETPSTKETPNSHTTDGSTPTGSSTGSTSGDSSVRTGDDTPVATYVVLLVAAAALFGVRILRMTKKR